MYLEDVGDLDSLRVLGTEAVVQLDRLSGTAGVEPLRHDGVRGSGESSIELREVYTKKLFEVLCG